MPDLLVKLYELPELHGVLTKMKEQGITIRVALAPEKHIVTSWVKKHFSENWSSEVEVAFAHSPISCLIAIKDEQLVGFACYDSTCKAFFGPTGVDEKTRGLGIGNALLLFTLHEMVHQGYAYAVIGDPGPIDFYRRAVGAIPIEGSEPGIYKGMLRN